MSQLLSNDMRSDNLGNQNAVVGTSDEWTSAGNELNRVHMDLALTDPNRNDRLLLTDMLDMDSLNQFLPYGYNTGASTQTFGADFIPNWGTMERQNPISHDNAQFRLFLIESTVAIVRRLLQA